MSDIDRKAGSQILDTLRLGLETLSSSSLRELDGALASEIAASKAVGGGKVLEETMKELASPHGMTITAEMMTHLLSHGAPINVALAMGQSLALFIILRAGMVAKLMGKAKCGGCGQEVQGPVYCGEKCRELVRGLMGDGDGKNNG